MNGETYLIHHGVKGMKWDKTKTKSDKSELYRINTSSGSLSNDPFAKRKETIRKLQKYVNESEDKNKNRYHAINKLKSAVSSEKQKEKQKEIRRRRVIGNLKSKVVLQTLSNRK